MEILTLIKKRRHVHHFASDPIPNETIAVLLEAARWAPSAGNLQPWEIIVVTSDAQRNRLVDSLKGKEFMRTAPVILVFCADLTRSSERYAERGSSLYVIQDTAAAIQNVLLTATGLGLGSGWIGHFDEGSVADLFELPLQVRPLALIMIGKAAEEPVPPPRRGIEEFTHLDNFGTRM